MFSWTFDAPTGTYKNHELSSKLRIASIAQTKFLQFIKPEPGYGKKKGESITITRLSNLVVPSNGRLAENNRIHVQPIPPTRGLIFDRNGVIIADNRPSGGGIVAGDLLHDDGIELLVGVSLEPLSSVADDDLHLRIAE